MMAEKKVHKNGITYFEISRSELNTINFGDTAICDKCLKGLNREKTIILVPILNEVFCENCSKSVLSAIISYPEDVEIEKRKISYYESVLNQ